LAFLDLFIFELLEARATAQDIQTE